MFEVFVSVKHFYVPNLKKISRPLFVRLFFNAIARFHFSSKEGERDIQLTYDKRIVSPYSDPKSTGKVADPGT